MNPPPLPAPSQTPPGRKSLAHHAATVSLLAAVVVILASAAFRAAEQNSAMPPAAKLLAAGAALVLLVGGLVLAIIGLCGIRQQGSSGLLGRGLAGLVINAALLVFFISGFVSGVGKGIKSRQTNRDLQVAVKELQSGLKRSFDPEKGITNFNQEGIEEFKRKLRAASTNLTGDDALVLQASAGHIERMQTAGRELETVVKELTQAHVLDFSDVTAKDQLQSRRRVVQRFAEVNQKLINLITNSETLYRADLQRLGVSPTATEQAMRGLHDATVRRNALLMQIRGADARIARGMSGVLDLLEDNWGAWKIDDTSGKVLFTRSGLVGPYNQFIEDVQTAGQDEIDAQRRLVNLRN